MNFVKTFLLMALAVLVTMGAVGGEPKAPPPHPMGPPPQKAKADWGPSLGADLVLVLTTKSVEDGKDKVSVTRLRTSREAFSYRFGLGGRKGGLQARLDGHVEKRPGGGFEVLFDFTVEGGRKGEGFSLGQQGSVMLKPGQARKVLETETLTVTLGLETEA